MSDSLDSSSGANIVASGNDDKVAYETHQKLLREKKAIQEKAAELATKLASFEANQKAQDEAKLKEKEDYKALLALRESEALICFFLYFVLN